jgi:hypothetical protein
MNNHWEFAFVAAIHRLEQLVWSFNFEAEAQDKAFSGIWTPTELITIINGFLDEKDKYLQGDVQRLNELRERLATYLVPAYTSGQNAAITQWNNVDQQEKQTFTELDNSALRKRARTFAPQDLTDIGKNWFVEAYCRQWREEMLNFHQREFEEENKR